MWVENEVHNSLPIDNNYDDDNSNEDNNDREINVTVNDNNDNVSDEWR